MFVKKIQLLWNAIYNLIGHAILYCEETLKQRGQINLMMITHNAGNSLHIKAYLKMISNAGMLYLL